jgi:hypothetical protein
MFILSDAVYAIPEITKVTSTGATVKFTATLSEILPKGYKVKIDLNNGKGLVAMTCSATTCTLSSNTLPKNVDLATYKVSVYDTKGILQGTTIDGSYVVVSTVLPLYSYTKISNSGIELKSDALLGIGKNDWACTKDNKTGLTWEVKTNDDGLRDMFKTYTNFSAIETGYGLGTNADLFVKAVNKQTLCGASNWRLPTIDELMSLVYCSDGKYDVDGNCPDYKSVSTPTISATYFPNTEYTSWYGSSSANNLFGVSAKKIVYFSLGKSSSMFSNTSVYIRLVHY